jgi:hypothetical protein
MAGFILRFSLLVVGQAQKVNAAAAIKMMMICFMCWN